MGKDYNAGWVEGYHLYIEQFKHASFVLVKGRKNFYLVEEKEVPD